MADFDAKEVRELLAHAEDADRENREEAIIDLKFEAGEQWDELDRLARESAKPFPLPCVTINVVQQYTGMVVGDWLQNETAIKVLPREDGDVNVAEVRGELIRGIELQSRADRVYASSLGQMVACGISNYRIDVDYAYEDAFEKDIFIRDIPDALAVRWDPLSFDPTGKDATYCFVADEMSKEAYKKAYPNAAEPSMIERECGGSSWYQNNSILVPEYWRIIEKMRTIGLTTAGKTVDLTDVARGKWPKLAIDTDTKKPIIREKVKCKYAVRQMTNGLEALDDPYELRLTRLPIIRVMGRETRTGEKRVRSGLIRWMRDSQRMKNYARSVRAELLMRAPRTNFIAPASAVEGREGDWDNALIFNDGAVPPVQTTLANLPALINEEQMYAQDMMEVTGIHEASRGMPSNETSGRAILARQNEGDTATIIFHANMTASQMEGGDVINQLIDPVFDTARTIRTVGPDLGVKMVRINDPKDDKSVDLTLGKYDVTISTGPSFQTRRQESAEQLTELMAHAPQIGQVAGDLIISEMDLVNGAKIAERVRRAMPPQILGDDANDGKSEEEIAHQQQAASEAQQMQQTQVQMQMQGAQAELMLKQAQAQEAQARAQLAAAQAQKAQIEAAQMASGGPPDPSVQAEAERTAIMGYQAETQRLGVLMKGNMPGTPPALEQHLAPIIANAVGQALAKHLGFAPVELGLPTADPALGEASNTDTPQTGAAA